MKALTMEELKNMDGAVVFTVPIVPDKPTFDPIFAGLGFHLINVKAQKLFGKNNDSHSRWKIDSLNKVPFGFMAFKQPVTEEQALQAWKELKERGMVKDESN